MCLLLVIDAPASARPQLEDVGRSLSAGGLQLHVQHPSRWSWGRSERVRAMVSESGNCACSLLTDAADWEAEYWSLRSDVLPSLAEVLEAISEHGVEEFTIEARWSGDSVGREQQVSTPEMLARIREGRLGTRTRYTVRPASGLSGG